MVWDYHYYFFQTCMEYMLKGGFCFYNSSSCIEFLMLNKYLWIKDGVKIFTISLHIGGVCCCCSMYHSSRYKKKTRCCPTFIVQWMKPHWKNLRMKTVGQHFLRELEWVGKCSLIILSPWHQRSSFSVLNFGSCPI